MGRERAADAPGRRRDRRGGPRGDHDRAGGDSDRWRGWRSGFRGRRPDAARPAGPAAAGPEIPEAKRKVGFAVVGLGELALSEIMPAFGQAKMAPPVALVSGHEDKAKKVAAAYGVDPDAIYDYENSTRSPTTRPSRWSTSCCPTDARRVHDPGAAGRQARPVREADGDHRGGVRADDRGSAETGRKLMIAYRLHYEPINRKVMEMCGRKEFGRVKTFSSEQLPGPEGPEYPAQQRDGGRPAGRRRHLQHQRGPLRHRRGAGRGDGLRPPARRTTRASARSRRASSTRCGFRPGRWPIAIAASGARSTGATRRIAPRASWI